MRFIDLKPKEVKEKFEEEYSVIREVTEEDSKDLDYFLKYTRIREEGDKSKYVTKQEELDWYKSLEMGEPDYSVYGTKNYYKEIFCCYIVYSRDYLKRIDKTKMNGSDELVLDYIKSKIGDKCIVDLGNGIGYSTASLSSMFDNKVYGTNLEISEQYDFNISIKDKYDFEMRTDINDIDNIGVVFASEYFEHIERPFEHLLDIINNKKPNFLIIANSFNKVAVGHFENYKYENKMICQTKAQRFFTSLLRELYKPIDAKFWNNTPMVWELKESSNFILV